MITERKNIGFGVILSYFSLFVSLLGTLFISNRILNLVGDYNYGLYSFVNSITSWLIVLSSALKGSFLRFSSIESKDNNGNIERTNSIYLKLLSFVGLIVLVIGLLVIGALYFFEINIGHYSWEDSKLMYLLFAFSVINISVTIPFSFFDLYISYRKQFVYQKILKIVSTVLNFVGHFLIAYFTRNIAYIAVFSIAITIFNVACNYLICKKLGVSFSKTKIIENKFLVKSISIFSGILLFNSIVDQISANVDKTLLGIFSTPENVAIYQFGQFFPSYLGELSIAISGVYSPTINKMVVCGEKNEVDNLFFKVSRLQSLVICFVVFGFLSCGKDFVSWWLGPERIYAFYVAAVLMVLNIMPLSVKTSIDVQRAMNMHKFRSAVFFTVAIANIGLSILFLIIFPPEYSIFACLLGTIISMVFTQWIAMNIYNWKIIKLPMKQFLCRLFACVLYGLFGITVVVFAKSVFLKGVSSLFACFLIEGLIFVFTYLILVVIFERRFLKSYFKK